jgi:ADP-heptose:LPS heptosyltransferase
MKIIVVMKNWLGDLLFQMPALDLIKKNIRSLDHLRRARAMS